jgi:hypothetical protein
MESLPGVVWHLSDAPARGEPSIVLAHHDALRRRPRERDPPGAAAGRQCARCGLRQRINCSIDGGIDAVMRLTSVAGWPSRPRWPRSGPAVCLPANGAVSVVAEWTW